MSGSVRSLHTAWSNIASGAPSQATRTRSRARLRLLADAIEAEIVPRLVAGYEETVEADRREAQGRAWMECQLCLPDSDPPTPAQEAARDLAFEATPQPAVDLAIMVLRRDEPDVVAHIAAAVASRGLESVCLDVLAPAARYLGDLWCEDICSFSEVTIGLMRLQSALLAVTVPAPGRAAADGRRTILLAPVPGDQHSFGVTMVAGFFERAGWDVTQLNECVPEALEAAVRAHWYGVIGLSAGSASKLGGLTRLLPRLRAVSRNPDLGIMLGGPVFVVQPELARGLGADTTAANGPHAVQVAEDLIAPRKTIRTATG